MIRLLCPCCGSELDQESHRCRNDHSFESKTGVLRLLDPAFATVLADVEHSLRSYRDNDERRLENPADYEGLPHSLAGDDPEWALRARDADNITRLLPQSEKLRILDIGAWNGWLSHGLARLGHDVTAVDYFLDEYDGLGAQQHYRNGYGTIQMDLADLSIIDDECDLVVVNHGLAFFGDPLGHLRSALSKVRIGGQLIVLGLQFFRDPAARKQEVKEMEKRYLAHCGAELFFRPTRAYLDWGDKSGCEKLGLRLHRYRHLWKQNLRSSIQRRRPYSCYATMTRTV